MLKKLVVRKGWTLPCVQTWSSTKTSDDIEDFSPTGSMDGCIVQSENQFVVSCLHVDTTRVLSIGGSLLHGELTERGLSLTSNCLLGPHSLFLPEVIIISLFHKLILPQESRGLSSEVLPPR